MSTAQVESALVEHKSVAESAVVACPHPVKGECLYCFVTPKDGVRIDADMEKELRKIVRDKIGPFASPDYIQVCLDMKPNRNSFSFLGASIYYVPRNLCAKACSTLNKGTLTWLRCLTQSVLICFQPNPNLFADFIHESSLA